MQLRWFVSTMALAVATEAYAEASGNLDVEKEKQVMGKVVSDCATITGANFLDDKCHYFSGNMKKQFAEEPAYCKEQITKIMNLKPEFWDQLEKAARETSENTECGDKSKSIVIQSFNISVRLHDALSKTVNGPNTTDLRDPR